MREISPGCAARPSRKTGRSASSRIYKAPRSAPGGSKTSEPVLVKTGSLVTITPRDVPGTPILISTTFQGLAQEVRPGSRILLSDGLIELRVTQVRGSDVECEVVNGGMLAEHQGINLPGAALSIPATVHPEFHGCRRDH